MSDKLRAVLRSAMQGAVVAVLAAVGQLTTNAGSVDMTWLRAAAMTLATAAAMGAASAIHNYILDPSKIPSLARPKK